MIIMIPISFSYASIITVLYYTIPHKEKKVSKSYLFIILRLTKDHDKATLQNPLVQFDLCCLKNSVPVQVNSALYKAGPDILLNKPFAVPMKHGLIAKPHVPLFKMCIVNPGKVETVAL